MPLDREARDHALYTELSAAGFKIAADIACFDSHHLNHLTPNTFCMDLYVAAMKHCLGELHEAGFRARATVALERLRGQADRDWMRLHFRHLSTQAIEAFRPGSIDAAGIAALVDELVRQFRDEPFQLSRLKHAGFKDFTEGPSEDTPILLRQDAYKALTEPVRFREADGTVVDAAHTARFGEIEERGYAITPRGREMYDRCLTEADAMRERDPSLPSRDHAAYEVAYAKPFAVFPKTLHALLQQQLVHGRYTATERGRAARGTLRTTDVHALVQQGFVQVEGLRYEDFLPVSAAGIFASNLNQYGTQSTAAVKPTYSQAQLENILGTRILCANAICAGMQAESLLATFADLGLSDRLSGSEREALERQVAACPQGVLGPACGGLAAAGA